MNQNAFAKLVKNKNLDAFGIGQQTPSLINNEIASETHMTFGEHLVADIEVRLTRKLNDPKTVI